MRGMDHQPNLRLSSSDSPSWYHFWRRKSALAIICIALSSAGLYDQLFLNRYLNTDNSSTKQLRATPLRSYGESSEGKEGPALRSTQTRSHGVVKGGSTERKRANFSGLSLVESRAVLSSAGKQSTNYTSGPVESQWSHSDTSERKAPLSTQEPSKSKRTGPPLERHNSAKTSQILESQPSGSDSSIEISSELAISSIECNERREPTWEWRAYGKNATHTPKKHILIAQYSSYGSYARLLELTSPINKAYARRWGHDFIIVQGSTLMVPKDSECEPPAQRAMYNKLEILRIALKKKKKYDQLLILDADAMMYDFSRDVTELQSDDDMLVAHRVSQKDPEPRTWDINNGITLWNLHHPLTKKVADDWYASTRNGVSGKVEHGDQSYLHAVLKRGDAQLKVRGLPQEFFYERGTVAKHFIRTHATNEWKNTRIDAREAHIENVAKEICERFPSDCADLERNIYID